MDEEGKVSFDNGIDNSSVDWSHINTEKGSGDKEGSEKSQVSHLFTFPARDYYSDQFFDPLEEDLVDVSFSTLPKYLITFLFLDSVLSWEFLRVST